MTTRKESFRFDIEGLRGVSILAVILYHFKWEIVGGGFVGVDVFFVISGYLITLHIQDEAKRGSFSFVTFYLRRLRRLFPALIFTIMATLFVAIFILSPNKLEALGKSAIAALLSLSNILFWHESGYFGGGAIEKPLLHTWSLSVEEQFYFFWPLLITLLVKFFKLRWQGGMLLLTLAIASFLIAQMWLQKDAQSVFFLTPFRVGEFALGALCAWFPKPRSTLSMYIRDGISLFGLALILFAIFSFSEKTDFPGFNAVIPCVGAALIIYVGVGKVTGLILTNRLIAGFGRISYSLYLVHWPVYVLFWQWNGGKPSLMESIALITLTFILSIAMYVLVENKFRLGRPVRVLCSSTRSFLITFLMLSLLVVVTSLLVWKVDVTGWVSVSDVQQIVAHADEEKKKRFSLYAEMKNKLDNEHKDKNAKRILIMGDSHAIDVFNALVPYYPANQFEFYGVAGCPPLVRGDYSVLPPKHPNRARCIDRNENILYKHDLSREDVIVINTVFAWYTPEMLIRAVKQISKKSEAEIVVLGNYLIFDVDFPDLVFRHGTLVMDQYYQSKLAKRTFAYEDKLQVVLKEIGVTYISKKNLLCEGDTIDSCPIVFDNKLYTYDAHHLSFAASQVLGDKLHKRYDHIFGVH